MIFKFHKCQCQVYSISSGENNEVDFKSSQQKKKKTAFKNNRAIKQIIVVMYFLKHIAEATKAKGFPIRWKAWGTHALASTGTEDGVHTSLKNLI